MITGSASVVVDRRAADVYEVITDVTRMGDFSPECVGGRWVAPATGPAAGATFEGDNVAALGPLTLKRWTTTSEVTECVPNEVFEFSAESYTSWRYELEAIDENSTRVTESFEHAPYEGFQKVLYQTIIIRPESMVNGMQQTLNRMKIAIETN